MLQQTMDIARGFGHVFLVSAIGGICSVAFGAWFSVTLVSVYVKYEPSSGGTNPSCSGSGSCSSAKVIGLLVFITFAGYWITEWLKNTIHSVIAGIYGSWFFCAGKPGGMPSGATRGALKRSLTYSFGSISFGSLVVAIINMVRQAVSIAQQQEAAGGNMCGSIAFCLLGCIIGLIDWAVQYVFYCFDDYDQTLRLRRPHANEGVVSGSSIAMHSPTLRSTGRHIFLLPRIRGR